jgi:hypothetical protein
LYPLFKICQTLAGAFAFLVAIVLYRMQSLASGLAGKNRLWESGTDESDWRVARDCQNWGTTLKILKGARFGEGSQEWQQDRMGKYARGAQEDFDRLQWLKRFTFWTGWATLISVVCPLILLPFSECLAKNY